MSIRPPSTILEFFAILGNIRRNVSVEKMKGNDNVAIMLEKEGEIEYE